MKKLLFLAFALFFFVACDKEDPVNPDDPTNPPPVEKKVEVKVKIGPLPENCLGLHPTAIGFRDAEGFFTDDLTDAYYKYPEFTYKFTAAQAEKYIGKQVQLYFAACREFPPGACWGMELFITFDPLKESQEVYIEIPPRDSKSSEPKDFN